eukprot:gene12520-16792_t
MKDKYALKSIHVLVAGGGISGLSLANLLVRVHANVKFRVTVFESRSKIENQNSIGGGIGLWPPSQIILQGLPNYQNFIEQLSYDMPFPTYRDERGRILAGAGKEFGNRFPVKCLNRNDLINMLYDGVKDSDAVEIVTSQLISDYQKDRDQILVHTENNKVYHGDILIACDGIHSKIRNCLMSELCLPPIYERELGYTYFRANVEIPNDSLMKWWATSFETWGTSQSKTYGNHEVRFGYVPLKFPNVFWFISIKTQNGHPFLSPIHGVEIVNDSTKDFLRELIKNWKPIKTESGDVSVNYEKLIDLTSKIIRTDIAKIENVEKFPWTSKDCRIVLMGDAAHATTPNIAQGAGLCIEDAACLVSKLNRVDYLKGLSEYATERKPRAKTVQNIADFIAYTGQIHNPFLIFLRNGIMYIGSNYFPWLQHVIFENVVSHSLGGSRKTRYWIPPPLSKLDDSYSSLFGIIVTDLHMLENHVKKFKTSSIGGSGSGVVTVERKPGFLSNLIGIIAGFPVKMNTQPFYAEVTNISKDIQVWSRIFGYKTPQQKTYSTSHSSFCGINQHIYLSEGIGGFLDKAFRFIYKIECQSNKSLKYKSYGITFFDLFTIPLPNFLLPKSEWVEIPQVNGWSFDGVITFPFLGTMMRYYGSFQINEVNIMSNKRVIIAGGSGMIGKEVCLEFVRKGYDVYCLSRSSTTKINIEGVKVRQIDEDWSDIIDKNTIIINLSGENPGAKRWTNSVKTAITQSRLNTIDSIITNINKSTEKPLKYLQASAVGIYGNNNDIIMNENSPPPMIMNQDEGTKFRVDVCEQIERKAKQANCNVINLRIGHVLSNSGGLLPYYRIAGLCGAGRFGSGNQYVPYVHIRDVAKSIEFIAKNSKINDGVVNITAPNPCTNIEMLNELRIVKFVPGVPLPKVFLNFLIGDSSVVLTDSERVVPERLLVNGFEFEYPTIDKAIQGLL